MAQAIIVFFLVGMEFTVLKFATYVLVLVMAATIGSSLGFLIGIVTADIKRMQEILTPLLMPMLIFSGYMIQYPHIPHYLRWIYHTSVYQYVFSSLVINHFADVRFEDCPHPAPYCYSRGPDFLLTMGIHEGDLTRDLAILAFGLALLCACGYALLRYKSCGR